MKLLPLLTFLIISTTIQAQTPPRSTAGAAPRDLRSLAVATFAGGCFWSHEETFEEVRGVREVVAGYAGGTIQNPTYAQVGSGQSGHAESVQIYYDPAVVSYAQLLDVFLLAAHNPTELNRQGPDRGSEYRSAVFYRTAREQQLTEAAIRKVDASRHYSAPIVTQVAPYTGFWAAESYHQGYYRLHPTQGYISHVSRPKVLKLRQAFPQLLKAELLPL